MAERRVHQTDLPLLFDLLSHTKSYRWKSAFFRKGKGISTERVEAIVDGVFYDSKVRKEVKRAMDRLGGPLGAAFSDLYLRRISNSVMGFSEGFLSVIQLAHSAMPAEGQITDWNCGSGNLVSALALGSAGRKLTAVDSNPRAVIATKRAFRFFFPEKEMTLVAKQGDPLSPELSIRASQGAVAFQSLYLRESPAAQLEVLKEMAKNLVTGGQLLLIEPKPWLQKQSALRLWVHRIAKSAAESHSPMSEFELALFIEFQRRLFLELSEKVAETKDLVALAKEAGFEVVLVRDTFYGHFTSLLLTKLAPYVPPKKEPVIRYHDDPWPT
jgi:SAM-dependent methyltransferase